MTTSRKLGEYSILSSSQESLDEYDRFDTDDVEFEVKLAEFPKPKGWGTRHTLTLMGFLGFVTSYSMRVNMSFAIVAMVNEPILTQSIFANESSTVCPQNIIFTDENGTTLSDGTFQDEEEFGGEFDWDGEDQGIILGSFYWSYVLVHIPAGILAEKIGGKWLFGGGLLLTAIFCLLTPIAARTGKVVLIGVRVMQGFGEGMTNPAMHALLAKWMPPLERSKLGGLVYTGMAFGIILTMPFCGVLISSGFLGGWPSGFYVVGALGVIWFIFWAFLVFNSPEDHPRIEANELDYIRNSIGAQTSMHPVSIPWSKIFTSMPVLALIVVMSGSAWGSQTLLVELPTYMKSILHYNLQSNGFTSSAPHLIHWILAVTACWYADYLREQKIASTTTVRKMFSIVGHLLPAVGLVCLAYSGCDRFLALTLLMTIVGINGVTTAGFQMNHIDIAPNHAATLMAITNAISNLCGIIGPFVVGTIIKDGSTLEKWRVIFLIAAAVYVVDSLFYLLFASGEEQLWNRPENLEISDKTKTAPDNIPLLHSGRPDFRKPSVLIVQKLKLENESEKNKRDT